MTADVPAALPILRIFLSSPMDVGEERAATQAIIDTELARSAFLRDRVLLRCIRFDDPQAQIPLVANLTPQEAVNAGHPKPSACGIVLGIFWNRLGTPLTLDGRDHPSGTAWEIADALGADPGPTVLLYKRTDEMTVSRDRATAMAELDQRDALTDYLAALKAENGGRSTHKYSGLDAFRAMVKSHLDHAIHEWLKRAAEGAAPETAAPARYVGNPYPGLFAYEAKDAAIFKGRGAETEDLAARLHRPHAVVPIIGASGSGKSSLMKAGVIPRLTAAGWRALELRLNEADPLQTLARALRAAAGLREDHVALAAAWAADPAAIDPVAARLEAEGAHLLLAIDQFEEIRLLEDRLRRPLLTLLDRLRGRERVRIILTLRADFVGDVQAIEPLGDWLSYSSLHLPPPGPGFLNAIIDAPLAEAGRTIAPELKDRLLREAQERPGALPLLSFALYRLVETTPPGDALTMPEGVGDSLLVDTLTAEIETVEAALSEAERARLPALFARLVGAPEDDRRTRARVARSALPEEVRALAEKLAARRLLTAGREDSEPRYELAHEALLTGWPSLADWFTRVEAHLVARAELERFCARWQSGGRAAALLAPDWLVAQGLAAQRDADGMIEGETADFLAASRDVRDARLERETRRVAELAEKLIDDGEQETAIRLCLEAGLEVDLTQQPAARGILRSPVLRAFEARKQHVEIDAGSEVRSVAFSPDGARLATGSTDRTARIWDAAEGEEITRIKGHGSWVLSVAFSADGARLATGSKDGTARIWDAATGEEIACIRWLASSVLSYAFSPDGARLATAGPEYMVRIRDMATRAVIARLEGHSASVRSVAFSPGGARLATGSDDDTARIWDAATGAEIARIEGHGDWVRSVAFSPGGARLATGSDDGTARIWDAATGAEIARLEGHGNWVNSVAFSPDGARLATGSGTPFGGYGTARIWDTATGAEIARLEGHGYWVTSVAFSPDGARLATGSGDRTAQIWNLDDGLPFARIWHPGQVAFLVLFAADGPRLDRIDPDGTRRRIPDGELPEDFIALLRALYPERLSAEERARFHLPPL